MVSDADIIGILRLHKIWTSMKTRCNYKPAKDYYRYGGRGISVHPEWNESCLEFIKWSLTNGYAEGLQIDRIDNDGNYEPTNCRWVTGLENARARPSNKLTLEKANLIRERYRTEKISHLKLAEEFGVGRTSITHILSNQLWADNNDSI